MVAGELHCKCFINLVWFEEVLRVYTVLKKLALLSVDANVEFELRSPSGVIFFFQAEDGIRDLTVTGVQTCALPIYLSGGQRKMVAITRAMMLSPSLLLLDEAFEGLAPVVVNRFTEAVMKIKAMGISILMAESHLAAASRIGDRLYAIDRGEIIFQGSPKDARTDERVMKALRG